MYPKILQYLSCLYSTFSVDMCICCDAAGECSSAGSDYVAPPQGTPDSLPEARRKRFRSSTTTSRDGDIVITICNDTVEEEPETFEVYLTDEYIENAYLFPHYVATVTILDDDGGMYEQHGTSTSCDRHVTSSVLFK